MLLPGSATGVAEVAGLTCDVADGCIAALLIVASAWIVGHGGVRDSRWLMDADTRVVPAASTVGLTRLPRTLVRNAIVI